MGVDAVLVVSFGGPEGPDEVRPFLERVTAGRRVSAERIERTERVYLRMGGVSPIGARTRELVAALEERLPVPVVLGNRFSPPFVVDALRPFEGGRLLAFPTTPYGGAAAGGAYEAAVAAARDDLGSAAPAVTMVGPYWNRKGFIAAVADGLQSTLDATDKPAVIAFTAHSVPIASAAEYREQIEAASATVARSAAPGRAYRVVWQSRSGPPNQPWLEPDINDHLRSLAKAGHLSVVVCPIGFVCDHMEIVNDLDVDAAATAADVGITMHRAPTAGTHPAFVDDVVALLTQAAV